MPFIHDIPHVNTVFIYKNSQGLHEDRSNHWTKVKSTYADNTLIYSELQLIHKQYKLSDISISIVDNVKQIGAMSNLDQIESLFMYTQLFKQIFLEMKHSPQAIQESTKQWRSQYTNNIPVLNKIIEFEQN